MNESIVLTVCREEKIHPVDFFGASRDAKLSQARCLAIHRLRAAGFNNAAIARLMKRNYSTVQYWLFENYRTRRVGYFRQLRARKKAALA